MIDAFGEKSDSLLEQAKAGNAQAQAELLECYRDALRRMISLRLDKRLAPRVDASDIVQEAMQTAHQRLPEYFSNPHIDFYPWLRRIAWDRLADLHRKHIRAARRSVLREHPWASEISSDSMADLARNVADSGVFSSQRAVRGEMEARVQTALLQLKPLDRAVLVLRYLEQLKVAEVACELGISPSAVTTRHLRALQRLRHLLDEPSDE